MSPPDGQGKMYNFLPMRKVSCMLLPDRLGTALRVPCFDSKTKHERKMSYTGVIYLFRPFPVLSRGRLLSQVLGHDLGVVGRDRCRAATAQRSRKPSNARRRQPGFLLTSSNASARSTSACTA